MEDSLLFDKYLYPKTEKLVYSHFFRI